MSDIFAVELGQTGDLGDLRKRSLQGISTLIKRQLVVVLIYVVSNIILARILAPQIFGIYAIVSFVVKFFSTFGDVGIGAALIQKKGQLNQEELSTTFWLQQMLVWSVVSAVFIAAPLSVFVYPTLPAGGVLFVRVLAFGFLFTSVKTIPSILMERQLDFKRIAFVDILENVLFYSVAIVSALAGFGIWSFIAAALSKAIIGAFAMFIMSSWRPMLVYRYSSVKGLVRFGLPYQGNSILAFIKDAVTPFFVGAYAGAAAVGYLSWAKNFAFAPLVLSEAFGRVSFPSFSRIQDKRDFLAGAVERSIRCLTFVMFPICALMISLGPILVHVVFTDKWLPGLWAYYFYCTSPLMIGIMLPMYSAILAVGRSGILLKMMGLLLILEWGLGVPLVFRFGFNGIAFSQPVITLVFYFIYKHVLTAEKIYVSVVKNIRWQLFAACISGIFCKVISLFFTIKLAMIFGAVCVSFVLYCGVMYIFCKSIIREFYEYMLNSFKKGK